jgi:hypothetical protein
MPPGALANMPTNIPVNALMPSHVLELVISNTVKGTATDCIHEPALETTAATKNRRKPVLRIGRHIDCERSTSAVATLIVGRAYATPAQVAKSITAA